MDGYEDGWTHGQADVQMDRWTGVHRVARYGPYPPSPYVLYGGRYVTYDDGSKGGRAGRCGHVLTLSAPPS
eukprot:332823-Chlamydomonas_euryale.AAC.1